MVHFILLLHLFLWEGVNITAATLLLESGVSQCLQTALCWCEIARLSLTLSLPLVFLSLFFVHIRPHMLPSGHTEAHSCTCKLMEPVNILLSHCPQSSSCSFLLLVSPDSQYSLHLSSSCFSSVPPRCPLCCLTYLPSDIKCVTWYLLGPLRGTRVGSEAETIICLLCNVWFHPFPPFGFHNEQLHWGFAAYTHHHECVLVVAATWSQIHFSRVVKCSGDDFDRCV